MKVTIYKKITQTNNGTDLFIDEILMGIKSGRWQDLCLPVMKETDKAKRTELKKNVPYFTAAGTFRQRNNSGLKESSGLIAIDFDDVDNLDMYIGLVNSDPYTFSTFKSISHTGFCALVKIDSAKHKESFDGLSNYYFQLLKIPIDSACKDISRPRFVSYDPDAFINPQSKIFKDYPKKESKQDTYQRTKVDYLHTDDKFIRVLKAINCDITGDYSQWVKIGFAIASKYGAAGIDYYNHISSFSNLYNKKDCDKQYNYCLRNKPGITIGTFYYYAKQSGINISNKSEDYVAKIAYFAKTGGRNKDSVKDILEMQNIEYNAPVIDAVFESDNFKPQNESGNDGKLNIEDIECWLKTNYNIKRNVITRFYENDGKELQMEDLNSMFIAVKKIYDKISRELFDTIVFSNFTDRYNPILDYFNSLVWDGKDYLTPLCESINSDTGTFDYRRILLQSWLLGIIESVYDDTPNVLQLILAGKQNTGKSIFFKKLLPKKIQQYFALSQLDKGKDDELLMCQKIIILDDEYSGKSKMDAKLIKRLLSAPSFDLREPYGKKNINLKRIATLCATSNETELLNDPTGNRRNIIFEVIGKFEFEKYNNIDKEQLFSQLVKMHKDGFRAELTESMIGLIEKYTCDKHSETSIEAECIHMQFEKPEVATDFNFMTATKIKDIIEKATEQKLSIKKLGMELKRMGYKRINKNSVFGYLIVSRFNLG
jgi:predicted P-loop ATPase